MLTKKLPLIGFITLLPGFALGQSILPPPPTVAAKSYVLMDVQTKHVITEFNSREKVEPASLTKIMTSYVAAAEMDSGRLAPDEQVPVSVNAWKTEGSRMFIKEGTTVSVADLLRGIIVQSGNDASVALAEYISGTEEEFAVLMNEYGKKLGLEDTNFLNATGLPGAEHLTSAYDSALLARALIVDFPEHYKMYAERDFTYNDIRQANRNRLLFLDESVDGVKTGYTGSAGYCLVASAVRDGMRLISVVMGTDSNEMRVRETRKLFSYGFRNFEHKQVLSPEIQFDPLAVEKGATEVVEVELRDSVVSIVPRGSSESLRVELEVPEPLVAPVAKGARVATARVMLDMNEIASAPVFTKTDVVEMGFFQGIFETIKGWFSATPQPD